MDRHPYLTRRSVLTIALLSVLLSGCESIAYYGQAAKGQWQIQQLSEPVSELLEDTDTPLALRQRLELSQAILHFAHHTLHLPDNGSYRHYADLQRPFVVWNLFVSAEFSTQLHRWCYPVAGCLSYRGYFDHDAATEMAKAYREQGFDTWIGGVRAYSTLGWLNDPLLNTFLFDDALPLAELIFHELAHQRVFAKGDTSFNESLATVIAAEGTRRWAQQHSLDFDIEVITRDIERRQAFAQLINNTRDQLAQLYRQPLQVEHLRQRKQGLLQELRQTYQQRRLSDWQTFDRFDLWMASPLNNAKLGTINSYYQWVPLLTARLTALNGDLPAFYRELEQLSALSQQARQAELHKMTLIYNK